MTATQARVVLAGPAAAVVAVLVALAMAVWVPPGVGQVDNMVLPLVLFPLIWAALFFHACLDTSLKRVAAIALALAVLHGAVLGWHAMSAPAATETKS